MATKRVVMFGGWHISSDNVTFEHASKNVIADYKKDMPLESIFLVNGANQIVEYFDKQIDRDFKDQHDIGELKLSVFTNACKIEIYGCSTAEKDSNFCTALSKLLYKKGKLRSVVIGHISKSNPNIRPNIKYSEQDYRHGKRGIYHNGKLLKVITAAGRITAKTINEALAGAA